MQTEYLTVMLLKALSWVSRLLQSVIDAGDVWELKVQVTADVQGNTKVCYRPQQYNGNIRMCM